MGLSAKIQKAYQKGYKAYGDGQSTVTYKAQTGSTYTASTGVVSRTFTSTTGVKGVRDTYTQREIQATQGRILSSDVKFEIPALNLPSTTPAQHDQVVFADSTVWSVVHVEVDTFTALWTLQLRRP